jgi:uncharacterized protein (DUF1499 family)
MARSWMLWLAVSLFPETAMAALFGDLFAGQVPAEIGARDGRLAPCPPRPNCVSSQAVDDVHHVAPFPLGRDADRALARLESVVAAQEGARVVDRRAGYLRAEFRSRLMGFVDDVEFLVDPSSGVIQVRSASRLGYSDLGVNRARVDALRAAYGAGSQ